MTNKTSGLAQLRQRQRLLQILVFSLITIIVWVSFSLFRSQAKTSISPEQRKLAEPLTPTVDIKVIETLEQKKVFEEAELTGFPIYKVITSKDGRTQSVVTIETPDDALSPAKPTPSPAAASTTGLEPTVAPISTISGSLPSIF